MRFGFNSVNKASHINFFITSYIFNMSSLHGFLVTRWDKVVNHKKTHTQQSAKNHCTSETKCVNLIRTKKQYSNYMCNKQINVKDRSGKSFRTYHILHKMKWPRIIWESPLPKILSHDISTSQILMYLYSVLVWVVA